MYIEVFIITVHCIPYDLVKELPEKLRKGAGTLGLQICLFGLGTRTDFVRQAA